MEPDVNGDQLQGGDVLFRMKPLTKFFICLIFVVIGMFLVDWETSMLGVVLIGISTYLAGQYKIKSIEEEVK